MKLKIISDGTNGGTKLIDEDTGEMIHGISKLTWESYADTLLTKVTVEFFNIPVEITTKADVELFEHTESNNWKPIHTKSFEKEIKVISSDENGKSIPVYNTKIYDTQTNKSVAAVQNIKWQATPDGSKAKVKKIKFDNSDW